LDFTLSFRISRSLSLSVFSIVVIAVIFSLLILRIFFLFNPCQLTTFGFLPFFIVLLSSFPLPFLAPYGQPYFLDLSVIANHLVYAYYRL